MFEMSEDDAAYSVLLAQLLSDSAPSRDARVHSWIEHQYDFVLSEQPHLPFASSRPPSPSPSSSLGAHRGYSIDRPDSPLLPRRSSDRTSSPCPSYDALFFPSNTDNNDYEEQERVRALRFIVQEMVHWKSHASNPHAHDKVCPPSLHPLPSLTPPSPSQPLHPPPPLLSPHPASCAPVPRRPVFPVSPPSRVRSPQIRASHRRSLPHSPSLS
ncbi:hypothetical protein EV363DRAFT_594711 [Boletus edulis]|nr:hypothetical protein EV363DRAFT_594711 [Boletus edulis]